MVKPDESLIDWPKIGRVWLGMNVAFAALVAFGVKAIKDAEREKNRVHWTDANRWER